jgi:sarcosine oxidase subunit alpha
MGQSVRFARTDGTTVEARIVSPVFYDPAGARQNV